MSSAAISSENFNPKVFFKEIKKSLSQPAQLNQLLNDSVKKIIASPTPFVLADQIASTISPSKMLASVKIDNPEVSELLEQAQEMFEQAKYGLEKMDNSFDPTLKSRLTSVLEKATSVLETVLSAFGLSEFFEPPENSFHSDMKTQKVMALFTLFSLLCTLLIPAVGAVIASAIVGGILFTIAALSIIYPLFKPAPSQLPAGHNLTKQYREGELGVFEGRKEKVDEVHQTLVSRGDEVKHPMLLGKSGVGKTELVKSLVQAIARGDYPELQGKQVIYFNMADLVNYTEIFGGSGNRILQVISKAMGKHRDKYILVFDEIQTAFQKQYQSPICEQLKTMLDRGPGRFPYVIGITTEEEYYRDIYLEHPAFGRRFNLIRIENTSPEETLEILDTALLKQAPHLHIDLKDHSLAPLLEKTTQAFPEAPMPGKAIEILSKCIHRTKATQKSENERAIEAKKLQIRALSAKGVHAHGRALNASSSKESIEQIVHLRTELAELEEQFTQEKAELDRFFQTRAHLTTVKRAMFHTAMKVSKLQQKALKKDQSAFLFYRHYLSPAIDEWVRTNTPKGVKTNIDEELIDSVIQEEVASAEQIASAVENAKKQIAERNK
ncbi:MAG: ATP-dependent Clp protease ATP-binding subunit [Verrucomicrobia bacterium]|nr:ATP-dependent Clp protease ATP-binding subunit [Verrucomicrobiota bacterium]